MHPCFQLAFPSLSALSSSTSSTKCQLVFKSDQLPAPEIDQGRWLPRGRRAGFALRCSSDARAASRSVGTCEIHRNVTHDSTLFGRRLSYARQRTDKTYGIAYVLTVVCGEGWLGMIHRFAQPARSDATRESAASRCMLVALPTIQSLGVTS